MGVSSSVGVSRESRGSPLSRVSPAVVPRETLWNPAGVPWESREIPAGVPRESLVPRESRGSP